MVHWIELFINTQRSGGSEIIADELVLDEEFVVKLVSLNVPVFCTL